MKTEFSRRVRGWPIIPTLALLPGTAHAFLGEFCTSKAFWILLLVTTGPTAILAEIGPKSWDRFFDQHIYLAALIGATLELFILWGGFRLVEKALGAPQAPVTKRPSTIAAGVFAIILVTLVLFAIADAKFGIITKC